MRQDKSDTSFKNDYEFSIHDVETELCPYEDEIEELDFDNNRSRWDCLVAEDIPAF